jgi:putative hydrolase of the HAD superfamily
VTSAAAIGFDLGDTLCEYAGIPLNWEQQYPAALAAVAECCRQELSSDRLASGIRVLSCYNTRRQPRDQEYTAQHIFAHLLAEWRVPEAHLPEAVAVFFAHFRQTLCAFPESRAVLHQLEEQRVPVGVLTDVPYGMPRSLVLADLSETRLVIPDDRLLTSTSVGYRKPRPEGFQALARALSVPCQQMLYVGNEHKDIAGARAAGCRPVLLWRGPGPAPAWGQRATIRSLDELLALPSDV